jgi:hypothetical protein
VEHEREIQDGGKVLAEDDASVVAGTKIETGAVMFGIVNEIVFERKLHARLVVLERDPRQPYRAQTRRANQEQRAERSIHCLFRHSNAADYHSSAGVYADTDY